MLNGNEWTCRFTLIFDSNGILIFSVLLKYINVCYRKMAQASSVDGDGNDQDAAALNKDADEEVCFEQI